MPSRTTCDVSVIIASYNCGKYLRDAIGSLLSQTLPPSEIIIIDDGSTDNTSDVIKGYEGSIIYIKQENCGEAAARNRALEVASGDYIAVQDADDICASDRIEQQVGALQRDTEAIACFTGHWVFNEHGRITAFAADPSVGRREPLDHIGRCLVNPPTILFDRRKSEGLLYPIDIPHISDMCFVFLLRTRAHFIVLPELLYGYRRRPGQLTQRHSHIDCFEYRLRWLESHRVEYWPDKTQPEIERIMWQGLADTMTAFYWARDREKFLQCQKYLEDHWPSNLVPPQELSLRWYPDWLWAAKCTAIRIFSPLRNFGSRT